MARGSASRMGYSNTIINPPKTRTLSNVLADHEVQKTIELQWNSMPKQVRVFLLETPLDSLDLHRFAKFWSSPMLVEHIHSKEIGGRIRDASYSIALNYLKLRKMVEARALMLNGSFIMECLDTPIETIVQWCGRNAGSPSSPEARLFNHALESVTSPQVLQAFLQKMLQMFCGSSRRAVVDHVGQTGDASKHSPKSYQKSSNETSEGTKIQLILVDDANKEERHLIDVRSSTTLKKMFNDYAEKRGISLRSLRFSYQGKTMFLSSAGNRTPDELCMKDHDVITVRNANNSESQETCISVSNRKKRPTRKQVKQHGNSTKKTKGKRAKKQDNLGYGVKSLEDYKGHHSKLLSKLHEEVEPRLKEMRTRLNMLDLERQPPKNKRKNKKKTKAEGRAECQMILPNSGVGGKAGKSHFMVHVGEIQNLYKTSKLTQKSWCKTSRLDLHGCTRDEALAKLDKSLTTWVETAMRGLYPFVTPAEIVCGCGNQILSETVEKWIREHDQIANSPKAFA